MELTKIDLQKTDSQYYKASQSPEILETEKYYYLTIEGQGDPNGQAFEDATEAIYSIAYGIKFICKGEDNDFSVPKMECEWWIAGDDQSLFNQTPRDLWLWKIMIRMPDVVESDHFFRAVHQVKAKKANLKEINEAKFETYEATKHVQILHLGSYDQEEATLSKLMEYMMKNDLKITGHHKEIYLSDPRRVAPEKLKTIIRYPVS